MSIKRCRLIVGETKLIGMAIMIFFLIHPNEPFMSYSLATTSCYFLGKILRPIVCPSRVSAHFVRFNLLYFTHHELALVTKDFTIYSLSITIWRLLQNILRFIICRSRVGAFYVRICDL